jgi:hypothetical protein
MSVTDGNNTNGEKKLSFAVLYIFLYLIGILDQRFMNSTILLHLLYSSLFLR